MTILLLFDQCTQNCTLFVSKLFVAGMNLEVEILMTNFPSKSVDELHIYIYISVCSLLNASTYGF